MLIKTVFTKKPALCSTGFSIKLNQLKNLSLLRYSNFSRLYFCFFFFGDGQL